MYLVADPGEWGGGEWGGHTPEKHYYTLNRWFLDIAVFLLLCDLPLNHLKTGFSLSWDAFIYIRCSPADREIKSHVYGKRQTSDLS